MQLSGRRLDLVQRLQSNDQVAETLERKGITNAPARDGAYRFLTTGDPDRFRTLGERFLQLPLGTVEPVALAELEAAAA